MKYAAYFGAIAALILGGLHKWDHDPERDVADKLVDHTVLLEAGDAFYGTGVWLDPYTIVTNNHVACNEGNPITRAYSADGEMTWSMDTFDVYCSKYYDLAILSPHFPNHDIDSLRLDDAEIGDRVFSYGAGQGVLSFKQGRVGELESPVEDEHPLTSWGITANPGDSGSPVFNDDGDLVGLINSGKAQFIRAGWNMHVIPYTNLAAGPTAEALRNVLWDMEHQDAGPLD